VGKNFIDTATSTAGGSVTLSIDTSTTSACSASANAGGYLISFLNTGNCVVDANEGSFGNYLAAAQTQETFTISPAPINLTVSYTGTGFQFGHTGTLQIVVTLSGSDGLVTFFNNNKKLFRCTSIQSVSYVATCNWKPDIHGLAKLTAYAIPSNSSYAPNTSAPMALTISARTVSRG
jgi:hypothetical protein